MRVRGGLLIVGLLVAGPAAAQNGFAVAGRAGTLGLGAEAAIGLGRQIGLRGGFSVQPWEPSRTFDDIEYTLDLASPSYHALLDVYPFGGGFRLSGGLVRFGSQHEVRAEPTEPVEVGGREYTPEQIGVLTGRFGTNETVPYLGIGFGRLAGRRGVGLVIDAGLGFQGEPDVRLSASGPISELPQFRQDLAEEVEEIEDDVGLFRFYPALSIGIVIGL